MYLVGIDIGKLKHSFCLLEKETGEILVEPVFFENNRDGFNALLSSFKHLPQKDILIGMEDTGHYNLALLKFLLDRNYQVALINPVATNLTRKMQGGISKNDKLDTLTICDVLSSNQRVKSYRISKYSSFDLYEQKQLTREHHNLKEEENQLSNRLQKCIDVVFPEFNSLFKSKYGIVYMNILKEFGSADAIAHADIRTLRKCFDTGRGKHISLTAEELKEQIAEIDKKIEEFSLQNNSPILSIPGISHFSGTSILAELGDIHNYSKPSQIIKFAGVAPLTYESSQFTAQHTAITKKGCKYLRKTLYQIITPVIQYNPVFRKFYLLKIAQGKGHRCAQGHCVRKLMRVIYHLLSTGTQFDPALLR